MRRSHIARLAAALSLALGSAEVRGADLVVVVQRTPLAGFRHHEAPLVWHELAAGDRLALAREPGNPHDRNAVRVLWRTRMLGYLPRSDNAAVARQLDRGAPLEARVALVRQNRNRSVRVEVEVLAPLAAHR